ncbi:MAG: type II secretion system F family protein, partial [Candidatus Neomarinimicrobiota bacterium]
MVNFKYIAMDKNGHREEDTVSAPTLEEAGHEIRKKGLKIINISKVKNKRNKLKISEINLTPPKINPTLKIMFFRELATLMGAGIQLVDGLTILKLQFKDKNFIKATENITRMVKDGHPFSSALKQHPKIFPQLVVSLIKAAELGGGLAKILSQIANYLEREENIRKKLKSATSYPKFVLGFFTLVLVGVIFGLLPKFKEIFESFGAELPGSTVALLAASTFIRSHLIIEIVIILGLYVS